jgi:hypothetical protein
MTTLTTLAISETPLSDCTLYSRGGLSTPLCNPQTGGIALEELELEICISKFLRASLAVFKAQPELKSLAAGKGKEYEKKAVSECEDHPGAAFNAQN